MQRVNDHVLGTTPVTQDTQRKTKYAPLVTPVKRCHRTLIPRRDRRQQFAVGVIGKHVSMNGRWQKSGGIYGSRHASKLRAARRNVLTPALILS